MSEVNEGKIFDAGLLMGSETTNQIEIIGS